MESFINFMQVWILVGVIFTFIELIFNESMKKSIGECEGWFTLSFNILVLIITVPAFSALIAIGEVWMYLTGHYDK